MKGRVLWFVAGTTAGVYGTFKAKRLADRFTPTGVADQVAAWQVGLQAFAEEVRVGMSVREAEVAEHLGLPPEALARALPASRHPDASRQLPPHHE